MGLIDRVIGDISAYQPAAVDVLLNLTDNVQYEQTLQVLHD